MDEFGLDDLTRKLLRGSDQVSHGLNLVLRLKNPHDMPWLLLEISKRQPKLDAALRELNFVHFARFLPSPGGEALLVITEFDGDLEPYAMDFAVAIGDIFTAILGYVEHAPPLPVSHHPDEFWDFVKRNNRVRLLGVALPEEGYYPLFSAYRDKTVLDIVEGRDRLPLPVMDRPGAHIDLADIQGNLLENYHARFARHFILTVTDPPRARSWLASLANVTGGPRNGLPRITTAACTPRGQQTMLNVGFTHAGLEALGLPPEWLARFPQAFREGPGHSQRARANGDEGDSAPINWIIGGPGGEEHVMLTLHALAGCRPQLDEDSHAIRNALADTGDSGLMLRSEHCAAALKDAKEHFGFRDGIAQPRLANRHDGQKDMQPAVSPGEFLLGANYQDIFGGPSIGRLPPQIATNGTFCAVRVLQQHVAAFEQLLVEGAAQLQVSPELVAAKLVGRWRDGRPLVLYPDEAARDAAPAATLPGNEFDYAPSAEYPDTPDDSQGLRCPLGAHIRRVNPRSSRRAGVRHTRRLIRRGMTYEWPSASGERRAGDGESGTEKGIFGLFYCGSIERQFEFVQQQWVNGDLFASGIRRTQDPIGGAQTRSGSFFLPGMGKEGKAAILKVPRLTTTRGSLYLFVPGLGAIRSLDSPALLAPAAVPAGVRRDSQTDEGKTRRDKAQVLAAATIVQRLQEEVFGMRRQPARCTPPTPQPSPLGAAQTGGWSAAGAADRERRNWALADTAPPDGAADRNPDGFDPTDPAFLMNPYPTYARFRQQAPVHYVPRHDAFWVFSHDLVRQLCTDNVRFLKQSPASLLPRGIFTMDPPRHTQVRPIIEQAFRKAIAHAQPIARRVVDRVLHDIHGDSFDLVEQFARRVPREVFFEIAGIPEARQAEVDRLARELLMLSDRTLDSLQHLYQRKVATRLTWLLLRLLPHALLLGQRDTLLFEVARQTSPVPGARLKATESAMTLLQFVLGGYMSTEFLLATGTRNLLLDDRRQWNCLQGKPERLPDALEEMRRFDTPLAVIDRYAASDIRFGGIDIPFGSRLMGMLGSANHDEQVFGAAAERFDISRSRTDASLALGRGVHECIGKPLQEIVASVALPALMQRFPDLALASPAQPPWFTDLYFRSFSRLAVCS